MVNFPRNGTWFERFPIETNLRLYYFSDRIEYLLSHSSGKAARLRALETVFRLFVPDIRERYKMPRSKKESIKPPAASNDRNFAHIQWCNITLSDVDLATLDAWEITEADCVIEFVTLIAEGYNVSAKIKDSKGSYSAFIIGSEDGCPGKGYGISAWSTDPIDAVKCVLFKFHHIVNGDFARYTDTGKPRRG